MVVYFCLCRSVCLSSNNFKVMNDRSHIGGNLRSRIVLYHMKTTFIAKVISILKPSIKCENTNNTIPGAQFKGEQYVINAIALIILSKYVDTYRIWPSHAFNKKITTDKTQFLQHLSFFPIYHECVWYHECCMKQINLYLSIHIPYEQTHCIWAGTNNAKINSITGRAHLGHKRGHYQCLSVIYPLLTVLSYMPVVLNYISS